MRIDLHAHSSVSDGTDSPTELVESAVRADLDVVAITDHDLTAGWDEATRAAEKHSIGLVRGIEISTKHRDVTVHLLAYEPDRNHPPLVEALERARSSREDRVDGALALLADLGIAVEKPDVLRIAGGAAAGEPHVARALVEAGHLRSTAEPYENLLEEGGRVYVARYTLKLADAISPATEAGGAAVVAHPRAMKSRGVLDEAELRGLLHHSLAGIEVEHPDRDEVARAALGKAAVGPKLVATGASDYHGLTKNLSLFHLGVCLTPRCGLEALAAVWEQSGRQ